MESTMSEANSPTSPPDVEYQQCYSVNVFSEVAGEQFKSRDGVYYQWFGGGPEGGVTFSVDGDIYYVRRDWGQTFTMKKIEGSPLLSTLKILISCDS